MSSKRSTAGASVSSHRRAVGAAIGLAAGGAALAAAARFGWKLRYAMGASRRELAGAADGNPQYRNGAFVNRTPASVLADALTPAQVIRLMASRGDHGKPSAPVGLMAPAFPDPPAALAATWLGHASVLLEIDGQRVLCDPVWSERVSPTQVTGPRRLHPLPIDPQALPELSAVVISHDHYDHLDLATVDHLVRTQRAPFLVPVGVGAHLRRWGVPEGRIVELDWGADHRVGDLTVSCVEARHFSGRSLRRNDTLWSSWVIAGPGHRVFFGGDTGYHSGFAEIGARFSGFDLTVLPIGAYSRYWPDIHMDPEQAWQAHGDLGGKLLLPIHWATFNLALHDWAEPVQRLIAAAATGAGHETDTDSGTDGGTGTAALVLPAPGERYVAGTPAPQADWWTASA